MIPLVAISAPLLALLALFRPAPRAQRRNRP